MKADLYQDAIVRHAKAAVGAGRLDRPDASVTLDNPLCGDRVTMDVRLASGRIAEVAHQVRGCLLCEASASVLGARMPGQPASTLGDSERAVRAMLEGPSPPAPLPEDFDAFAPVRDYRSRHACVLLPFEALRAAVDQARKRGQQ